MNKQQLASKIWESANKMRSKIEASDYKDFILGFIFYKFLSENERKFLISNDYEDSQIEALCEEENDDVVYLQSNIGYFIAYKDLFSTWIEKGMDFSVDDVNIALHSFNRFISKTHEALFGKIFDSLQKNISKLGASAKEQTKAIRDLMYEVKDIPMDGKQDYDVLGFIYEYLLEKFASSAGKKAGEFYTPHEVSFLMSEIVAHHLKDKDKIKIYDPTSGSGSLLINIGKSTSRYLKDKNQIMYYAQELKENTYNLTRMNLVMRGILPHNIVTKNADTLEDDWPLDDDNLNGFYKGLSIDAVVSNPPYSQAWEPQNKDSDPRYVEYGLAPKTKADYAFLLHDLYHVDEDGIMTIVLPHGVLFRGGEEGKIRKNLIEKNKIDAIIGLPPAIFYGTSIPTIILVLKHKKSNNNDDVLIIDASKGFIKDSNKNRLRQSDIKKIVDAVINRQSIQGYAALVSRDVIRQNDYNLNIPRYVDLTEKAETWDIYATMFGGIPNSELDNYQNYWDSLSGLKDALLEKTNEAYSSIKVDSLKDAVFNHQSVELFESSYNNAFADMQSYLKDNLVNKVLSLSIPTTETQITNNIFDRLKDINLVDRYYVYQLFSDEWKNIETDLEIIQTEQFDAIKKVDPNMVVKKVNGKSTEVQDGWIGHIVPFDIVKKNFFKTEVDNISSMENRISEIDSNFEELLEEFSEEEKYSATFISDDKDKFVIKEVSKEIKKKVAEIRVINILKQVEKLDKESKQLKKDLKIALNTLETLTKEKIENLTNDESLEMLNQKWILPIIANISKVPSSIINEFISKLEYLKDKYKVTFEDVENEISETETALTASLSELTGNEFDEKGLEELKKLLGGE